MSVATTHRRRSTGALCVAAVLGLSACSSGQTAATEQASGDTGGSGADAPVRIAYIQKQGDQQYFVDEAEGAREEAERLGGVEVSFTDVGLDSNAAITAVQTAVAQGVDAVAIVVPDAQIGPQVADLLRRADVPFVASDDPFDDASGKRVPWVSIESRTMGEQVGQEAGRLYAEAGWDPATTRVLSVLQEDLGVCQEREAGQLAAFEQAAGTPLEVVRVGTDNTVPQAQSRTGAAVTANQGVENWVVVGCNDEGVTGAVTALANAGFGAQEVIGVGLGGYLACKDWVAGTETGNKAALYIDGRVDGAAAVRVLVETVREGVPLPAETLGKAVMVNPSTWEEAGLACT